MSTKHTLRVHQVSLPLDGTPDALPAAAAAKLGVALETLARVVVLRRSLDARATLSVPCYSLSLEVDYRGEPPARWRKDRDVAPVATSETSLRSANHPADPPRTQAGRAWRSQVRFASPRPVVVGAGPAGLMAALQLARAGLRPRLLERGAAVESRAGMVSDFWRTGTFDARGGVLHGEGGAGLFSDGKLTSRSKDRPRIRQFLETLVEAGADADILIDAMPHLGSDRLLRIVPNLRRMIVDAGGEVRCNACLESVAIERGKLAGIVADGETIAASHCLVAIGHSACDTVAALRAAGVACEAKAFAVGVRLELPQWQVDRSQWGRWAGHAQLGAASFRLTRREEESCRSCYSFCMCPGGSVIACTSAPGVLTTNGMSLHTRDKPFANAAFLVPVTPADYLASEGGDPLAGFNFQRRLEAAAWEAGGGDFSLPASPLGDFLAGRAPAGLPAEKSCPRAVPAEIGRLLPDFVAATLRRALPAMLHQLACVNLDDALVYGVESRSSSPVRMLRDDTLQSLSCRGLYPCGEGAGYAGGIVSSAVDGLKAAEALLHDLQFN